MTHTFNALIRHEIEKQSDRGRPDVGRCCRSPMTSTVRNTRASAARKIPHRACCRTSIGPEFSATSPPMPWAAASRKRSSPHWLKQKWTLRFIGAGRCDPSIWWENIQLVFGKLKDSCTILKDGGEDFEDPALRAVSMVSWKTGEVRRGGRPFLAETG